MITTVSHDQTQILQNIRELYLGGAPLQVDLTYGNGGFWAGCQSSVRVQWPLVTSPGLDRPRANLADMRHLPFKRHAVRSIVLDPPFIHAHGKASVIGAQFGSYKSQNELRMLYASAICEAHVALMPGGILVFKCQDIVESGRQVWNHCTVRELASSMFEAVDLFILLAQSRVIGWNHHTQKHARKFHSYFWVLRAL